MPARLYFDVHVPAAILEALLRRGVDVLTSQKDGTRELSDEQLLERAMEFDRALFSQDADFLSLGSTWQASGRHFPGILILGAARDQLRPTH